MRGKRAARAKARGSQIRGCVCANGRQLVSASFKVWVWERWKLRVDKGQVIGGDAESPKSFRKEAKRFQCWQVPCGCTVESVSTPETLDLRDQRGTCSNDPGQR